MVASSLLSCPHFSDDRTMGGHGGLNILPQKSWNVYNYDNREKVRKDEEAAAHEEQVKREESRRRDFEVRLQTLRQARGGHTQNPNPNPGSSDSNHINLFENISDFSSIGSGCEKKDGAKIGEDGGDVGNKKRRKREEAPAKVVITPEEEKYRLGYGLMGKGVKEPWYLSKRVEFDGVDEDKERGSARGDGKDKKKKSSSDGKKSIEELREERMRREGKEKGKERALLLASKKRADTGFSRRM